MNEAVFSAAETGSLDLLHGIMDFTTYSMSILKKNLIAFVHK